MIHAAFPWVRVICAPQNLGFGGGSNLGARMARGRYLAFLNPDTVVTPGWLDALMAALASDPTAGLATAKILLLDDPRHVNTCGNTVHVSGLTLCRGFGGSATAFACPEEVDAVSGAAFVIRRELFEALGGFDAAFFLYMEDTDLSWRARLCGYRCLYVPDAVIYHRYAWRCGPQKVFYHERNRYAMLLKCLQIRTLFALLPVLLVAEIITWGFVLLRERQCWKNKVRAYGWVLRHWPAIAERRREIQSLRCVSDDALIASAPCRLDLALVGNDGLTDLAGRVFGALFFVTGRLATALIR
jgi:GT2 family glycosyltransferase